MTDKYAYLIYLGEYEKGYRHLVIDLDKLPEIENEWVDVLEEIDFEKYIRTWNKALIKGSPGTIEKVKIEYDEDNRITVWTPGEYIGFTHGPKIAIYSAYHDSYRAKKARLNKEKREKQTKAWQALLWPIRIAYQSSTPNQKSALLAIVIEFTTRGSTVKPTTLDRDIVKEILRSMS